MSWSPSVALYVLSLCIIGIIPAMLCSSLCGQLCVLSLALMSRLHLSGTPAYVMQQFLRHRTSDMEHLVSAAHLSSAPVRFRLKIGLLMEYEKGDLSSYAGGKNHITTIHLRERERSGRGS
jgi:hypothetical protein